MKKTSLLIAVFLIAGALRAQSTNLIAETSIPIDGYAARVNDRVITRSEVRDALAPMLPELYRAFQGPQLEEELDKAYARVRTELIERALIMEAFETRGGQIPDQYVNEEIKRIINDRFKGDKALFEQVLTEQKKTRSEYMEMIREQMAVGMISGEEVSRRVRITPKQVRDAYDSNPSFYAIPAKVKHSVIVLNKGLTPEDLSVKRSEAEAVRRRLLEGADFNEVAKEVSEGSRAAEGGAFPWLQLKDIRPELREVLAALSTGSVSEIIETEAELYLVKLEARRQSGMKSFDEVRDEIKARLMAEERSRLRQRWIDRLMKNHYVVIYD